jgi:hypothetical protein
MRNRVAHQRCGRGCGRQSARVRPQPKAWLGGIDIAINKAFASRALDIATKQLADFARVR